MYRIFGFGRVVRGSCSGYACPVSSYLQTLTGQLSGCSGHSLASRLSYTQRYSISVARNFVNFLSHAPYYIGPCPWRMVFLIVLITTGVLRGHRHWHLKIAYRVPKDEPYNKTSWNAHWTFRCILKVWKKCWQSWYIRMHQQTAAFCVRSDMQLTVHDRGL